MIGPYRLEREIARGGMGVVYLAHDTRLGRTVALKSLPVEVASEPERLERFERESRLLASLNHPNIAAIYDIVESEGRPFLALEHVEGETLANRIARGALALHETIEIAFQIASGMEAAHEQGVIHRDLKPGNVMITPGDQVKIVDFGLAKGRLDQSPDTHSPTLHPAATLSSPTISSPVEPGTIPGVILGTAPYLSPEQARGKAVDRRTDIWALGCIVYECLTGKRAFEGETVSDTIARILEREPDWSLLPGATPARLRELLRRMLEKDPRRRLRDMGEARLALEDLRSGRDIAGAPTAGAGPAPAPARGRRIRRGTLGLIFGAGLTLGAALALNMAGVLGGNQAPPHLQGVARAFIPVPAGVRAIDGEITTDGKYYVMLGAPKPVEGQQQPPQRLYVKPLDRGEFTPIEGTEGAEVMTVTQDGHYAFAAPASPRSSQQKVFRGPLDGSAPPVPFSDVDPSWQGRAVSLESGEALVSEAGKRWVRFSLKGGGISQPRPFGVGDSSTSCFFSSSLPHDRGALVRIFSYQGRAYRQGIGVLDLKSGRTKLLVEDGGSPHYASTGHLLFTRGGNLLAVPFDLDRLEVKGEPVAILGGLRANSLSTHAEIDLAANGTLVFATGGAEIQDRHAIIVNLDGTVTEWSGERQPFERTVTVSPDGRRFASVITNSEAIYEIWVSTRGSAASQRVIAVPGADCDMPLWSPDGTRIAYFQVAGAPNDGIYEYRVDGSQPPRLLCRRDGPDQGIVPMSWLPDGSRLLCLDTHGPDTGLALLDVPPPGGPTGTLKRIPLGGTRILLGSFSRDGRWLGYIQQEGARSELFVRPFHPDGTLGDPTQLSQGGATVFAWSRDGKDLLYGTPQGKGMRVAPPGPGGTVRPPVVGIPDFQKYRPVPAMGAILPGDQVLLIQRGEEEDDVTRFDVVFNFFDELQARMKGK